MQHTIYHQYMFQSNFNHACKAGSLTYAKFLYAYFFIDISANMLV